MQAFSLPLLIKEYSRIRVLPATIKFFHICTVIFETVNITVNITVSCSTDINITVTIVDRYHVNNCRAKFFRSIFQERSGAFGTGLHIIKCKTY